MKRPWFKFYPGDWQSDNMLRMCSIGARGLWAELLCIMHDSHPRGSLIVNGRRPTNQQLGILTGVALKEVGALMLELEVGGVFSRDKDGTIFSRRIRRDEVKAQIDRDNGKGGGNPALVGGVNPPVKPPDNDKDKAQNLEARKIGGGEDAGARGSLISSEAKQTAEAIAEICGIIDRLAWPPGWCGSAATVQNWLNEGCRPEIIIPACREAMMKRRDGAPDTIRYFEKAVARAQAQFKTPMPTIIPGKPEQISGERSSNWPSNSIKGAVAKLQRDLAREGSDFEDNPPMRDITPASAERG